MVLGRALIPLNILRRFANMGVTIAGDLPGLRDPGVIFPAVFGGLLTKMLLFCEYSSYVERGTSLMTCDFPCSGNASSWDWKETLGRSHTGIIGPPKDTANHEITSKHNTSQAPSGPTCHRQRLPALHKYGKVAYSTHALSERGNEWTSGPS